MKVWRQRGPGSQSMRRVFHEACVGVLLGLVGCGGGEGPPDVTLESIELTPPSTTLQVGATQAFTATGHFSDGSSAAASVTWTATGGTISSAGLFTAGSVTGNFQVIATEQGGSLSKAAAVTITAAPPVLTSISVAPATISLAPATTQQFVATGHFSGGGTGSVAVNWGATGGTITAAGLYTAGAVAGPYAVTATLIGGSTVGTAAVTITPAPPTLTSITVAPGTVTLAPGITQQFTATAHYSDASTGSIPVDWIATGGVIDAAGLYTAGATDGPWQVSATATGTSVTGTAAVTITTPPANIVAIEVSPAGVRLKPGDPAAQFTAVGRLSTGGTTPVPVTWTVTSASPPAACCNTIGPTDGRLTAGNSVGTYVVTATQQGGPLTGTMPFNVHQTGGSSVVGPNFWTPTPGFVYLCTSNHFTDDALTNGAVATITANPATGVTVPTVAYTNDHAPVLYASGDGEVAVVCQQVWSAPGALVGSVNVTISVASNRPGTGMAKVFSYETSRVPPPTSRAHFSQVLDYSPNWTANAVAMTVVVSATDGANIWFKNTDKP